MAAIPDVPEVIELQSARRDFIATKVIDLVSDDPDDDVVKDHEELCFQEYPEKQENTYSGSIKNIFLKNMK